jgi:hypothetical protein
MNEQDLNVLRNLVAQFSELTKARDALEEVATADAQVARAQQAVKVAEAKLKELTDSYDQQTVALADGVAADTIAHIRLKAGFAAELEAAKAANAKAVLDMQAAYAARQLELKKTVEDQLRIVEALNDEKTSLMSQNASLRADIAKLTQAKSLIS